MKLTQDQISYLSQQDWQEAMPFGSISEPIFIDGAPTEFKKSYSILESRNGDRVVIRSDKVNG